ncbi:MAG TPA: PAS domain-containing sensor histidine kinase [Ferruginibacter sp.]|nr:PAS domain-containing sensor histidine kinase [Ferruginibacter sp.]
MDSALKKEKDRFEALFEYASMGIVVTNAEGNIEMVNHFLLKQFGYEKNEELAGKKIEVLIPRRYDHMHHKHRENYGKAPGQRVMGVGRDLFALKKDGSEFPVEVSLSNYNTIDGMFVIAFVIDITLRKQSENELLNHKAQLELNNQKIEELNDALEEKVDLRTSQLQQALLQIEGSRDELTKALSKEKELGDLKSRFVSMASHEFRTPLSTILSSASLLAKYTESAEQDKRNKHILRIKGSVNNLTDILNEFLSIGKIEDGKIEVRSTIFNVKEFLQNICTEMQANAKPKQKIVYTHKGEEWIKLDASLLRNIVFNLLSNAIKFSSEDGIILFDSVGGTNHFSLCICDSGIGISKEDQVHLFERFFRASNVTNIQGTGLGLHIVSKYVELLNGRIHFKSELEKGTSFTINFQTTPNNI